MEFNFNQERAKSVIYKQLKGKKFATALGDQEIETVGLSRHGMVFAVEGTFGVEYLTVKVVAKCNTFKGHTEVEQYKKFVQAEIAELKEKLAFYETLEN